MRLRSERVRQDLTPAATRPREPGARPLRLLDAPGTGQTDGRHRHRDNEVRVLLSASAHDLSRAHHLVLTRSSPELHRTVTGGGISRSIVRTESPWTREVSLNP